VIWLIVVLAVVAVLLLAAVVLYNRLVRLRNEVETGWANIDVQLKRRTDLIPNLVQTVKGYAAHERGVFEEVTQARVALQRAASPSASASAGTALDAALGRLFAARRYYNATVLAYNSQIQTFPSVLLARPFGFREREFFDAEDEARAPVEVEFSRT
jgi:LemA protein